MVGCSAANHRQRQDAAVAFPLDLARAARRYRKYALSGQSGLTVTVAHPVCRCLPPVRRRGCEPSTQGKTFVEAAILMLALAAPGQHPLKLDATLLWHELRPCGDGFRRGCGPDCYRCRSCNGLGRCYDYRGTFGYPWNPRHSRCATGGYAPAGTSLAAGKPLPPVVVKIDPSWQPPPWHPGTLPPDMPLPLDGTLPPDAPLPYEEPLPPSYLPGRAMPPGAMPPGELPLPPEAPYFPAASVTDEVPSP